MSDNGVQKWARYRRMTDIIVLSGQVRWTVIDRSGQITQHNNSIILFYPTENLVRMQIRVSNIGRIFPGTQTRYRNSVGRLMQIYVGT